MALGGFNDGTAESRRMIEHFLERLTTEVVNRHIAVPVSGDKSTPKELPIAFEPLLGSDKKAC